MSEPAGAEAAESDDPEVASGEELEELEEVSSGATPTRTQDLQLTIDARVPQLAGTRR